MGDRNTVLGLFHSEEETVSAIKALHVAQWTVADVYSPIPSHEIADALKMKKSKVGYFTLAGAVFGFFFGFWLAAYASDQWHLIVSGKPVVALIPFFIVGFELTILFGVIGNVAGFLFFSGLPGLKPPAHYDPRCSGEFFGVAATCAGSEKEALTSFFTSRGAVIGTLD